MVNEMTRKNMSTPLFVSSFTPKWTFTSYHSITHLPIKGRDDHLNVPLMVAPKNVRRADEMKRLAEQLEELRAKREKLKAAGNRASSSTPTPSAETNSKPQTLSIPTEAAPPTPTYTQVDGFTLGKHSSGNRFLSISSVEAEEYHPRVILLAGAVPGLTTEEYKNVPPMLYNKEPKKGNLFICRLPEEFKGDFMTVPTYDVLAKCGDPVGILSAPDNISATKLPVSPAEDVILIVDRDMSDFTFDKDQFYVWDVNGQIQVGWVDQLPVDNTIKCVGRVVCGHIEVEEQLRSRKSCWEEENETYS